MIDNEPVNASRVVKLVTAAGKNYRVTGITFSGVGGRSQKSNWGYLSVSGQSHSVRIDHIHATAINNLNGISIVGNVRGVADHIVEDHMGEQCMQNRVDNADGLYGDTQFAQPAGYGGADFFFFEDWYISNYQNGSRSASGGWDARGGAKFVVRHCHLYDVEILCHGTEIGRWRSGRAQEIYNNDYHWSAEQGPTTLDGIRGGTLIAHDNTFEDVKPYGYSLADFRMFNDYGGIWGGATGNNGWDNNDGHGTVIQAIDQPGLGQGDLLTGDNPTPRWLNQRIEGCYSWNNRYLPDNSHINFTVHFSTVTLLQEGRDFFNDTPLPGYTPYTYPHPLVIGGSATPTPTPSSTPSPTATPRATPTATPTATATATSTATVSPTPTPIGTATPHRVGSFVATAVSCTETDLRWSYCCLDLANGGFDIERGTDNIHFTQINQIRFWERSYRDTTAPSGLNYYRIRAFNDHGVGDYSFASATQPSCQSPTPTPTPTATPCLATVPDFDGVKIMDAQTIWESAGFSTEVITDGPPGQTILWQSLPPGYQGDCSTTVIVVSSQPGNISTRAFVQTGDNVMIGGFIVQGTTPKRVIIRAIGPELGQYGVPNQMADPTLELHDGSGALISSNDNWQTTIIGGIITNNQVSDIQNSRHAPGDARESAIIADLPAGNYTAIVRGVNSTTGVALVEVYDLSSGTNSVVGNIRYSGLCTDRRQRDDRRVYRPRDYTKESNYSRHWL